MISQLGPVVGGALVKRWTEYQGENPDQPRVPSFSVGQYILSVSNLILLIPVFLYMAFTLGRVFPTLAMVEDPLPKYDAIPIADPNDDGDVNKSTPGPAHLVTARAKPITSSLRATHRLLSSIAGWRSQFRGLGCYLFQGFLTVLIAGPLTFIIGPFGHLAALLILTRFSTGLTHIIITKPSDVNFFKRLPPMRRTLTATYIPILFHWLAAQASIILPHVLAYLVAFDKKGRTPRDAAKLAPIAFLGLAMHLFLVFPSYVALVRVQASLLPHEEETIVPFDRSFGGRVEPQVVSGKGFASFRDALATVPQFSWIRLYVQQVKIIGVTLGLVFLCFLLVALELGIGMALFH